MLRQNYSESFSVRNCGPRSRLSYVTTSTNAAEETYYTSATFVPSIVPRYYISSVLIDSDEPMLTKYERVEFVRRIRGERFVETVKTKPKSNSYKTTLTYNPDYKHYRYITRLDLRPAVKFEEATDHPVACNGRSSVTGLDQRSVVKLEPATDHPDVWDGLCNEESVLKFSVESKVPIDALTSE